MSKSLRSLSLRTNDIHDDHYNASSTPTPRFSCQAAASSNTINTSANSTAGVANTGIQSSSSHNRGGGISALTAALCVNTTLASLSLSANQLGDESASQFANLLRNNATLTSMSLSNNDVGDTGGILQMLPALIAFYFSDLSLICMYVLYHS